MGTKVLLLYKTEYPGRYSTLEQIWPIDMPGARDKLGSMHMQTNFRKEKGGLLMP